jgi:hypothetical protein
MNLFVEKKQAKSERKFFEFKVRMLHVYAAAASSSLGILLNVCCCSLLKLLPVPFHVLLLSSKEVHEKKRNKTDKKQ